MSKDKRLFDPFRMDNSDPRMPLIPKCTNPRCENGKVCPPEDFKECYAGNCIGCGIPVDCPDCKGSGIQQEPQDKRPDNCNKCKFYFDCRKGSIANAYGGLECSNKWNTPQTRFDLEPQDEMRERYCRLVEEAIEKDKQIESMKTKIETATQLAIYVKSHEWEETMAKIVEELESKN